MQGGSIQPFTIAGTGKQVRDVLHADDLVMLYRRAYEHRDKMQGEIFNIGGAADNSLSLLELFNLLSHILGTPELIFEKMPRRASDQDCFIASIAKAQRMLNWTPQVTCESGIRHMLDWCQELGSP